MDKRLMFIFKRRSIRKFKPLPVSEEDIKALLEAGMSAPSARNLQPWHFIVITGRQKLNRLAEIHPYADMLRQASVCLAVCADPEISPRYWVQDCSAATENILIAAANLGLGAVWLGCHPRKERKNPIKKILEIPEEIELLSLIAVGYPAEFKEPRTQFNPQRVHYEKW